LRVRRLVELVRPHVDEVVLAVHEDAEETIEVCREVVDKLLVHAPLDGSSASALVAWLLDHCGGDWILRLDDDELPSTELLAALPELTASRRSACAVSLRRRWVYPDTRHWISSPPWGLEYQTRLLRNLPSVWAFTGEHHTEGVFLADRAMVAAPIYHLDLMLNGLEDRLHKRDQYESMVPDLKWDLLPLNDQYVPELHEPLARADIPRADRRMIESLLDPPVGSPAHNGAAPEPVEATPLREILVHNAIRVERSDDDLPQGELSFITARRSVPARAECWFELEATNRGQAPWPYVEPPFIRVGARWVTAEGARTYLPEGRGHFSQTVWPGTPARVLLSLVSPTKPGRFLLEADLAHEGVRWFGLNARIEVEVVARPVPRRAAEPIKLEAPSRARRWLGSRGRVRLPRLPSPARAGKPTDGGGPAGAEQIAAVAVRAPQAGASANGGRLLLPQFLEDLYAAGVVTDADGREKPVFGPSISRGEACELAEIVRDGNFAQTLETGMAYGLSTMALAGVHAERGAGDHIAIDFTEYEHFEGIGALNLKRAGLEDFVEVIAERSELVLPRLAAEGLTRDFVFIDGSHLFDWVVIDFFYADRLLEVGGVIALHDTLMPAVRRAIDFVSSNLAYEQLPATNTNLAVLRKLAVDTREWDHYVAW
jgi:predicted O-methyltransferase YrrM